MDHLKNIQVILQSQAKILLPEWLPNGKFRGKEYIALNPTRSDKHLSSFSINMESGKWADFATGERGSNLVGLYSYIKQIEFVEALKVLSQQFNYFNKRRNITFDSKDLWKIELAEKLYNQSITLKDTLGEQYFRFRGIVQSPSHIRFNSELLHQPSGQKLPAIISPIVNYETNAIKGIHRIYLQRDVPKKTNYEPNKMMLGDLRGHGIRLFHEEHFASLVLCEGLETGLSIFQTGEHSVFVMLSATNLQKGLDFGVTKPENIIIAADNDKAGIQAANKAADIFIQQKIKVSIAIPMVGNDFNDTLLFKE